MKLIPPMATTAVPNDTITMLTAEEHLRVPVTAQTWDGNDMDIYAGDFAQLREKHDRKDAIPSGTRPEVAKSRVTLAATGGSGLPKPC